MSMRCVFSAGSCSIECANHYRGFGPVTTSSGRRIHILGAPSLYATCEGAAGEAVIEEKGNERSCALLRELLKAGEPDRWGERLSGNFLIAVEHRTKAWLITDIGNSYHLFRGERDGKTVLCTDIDRLAHELGTADLLDLVSITDYLTQKSISYPFTFYAGLVEAPYASTIEVEFKDRPLLSSRRYWSCANPNDTFAMRDMDGLARRLYSAAQRSLDDALEGRHDIGLFLSGGLDSRVLAAMLMERGVKGTALTFCDGRNNETGIAARIASIAGLKHEFVFRDADYYARTLPGFLEAEGPHFNFIRCTFFGFREEIARRGFDCLLGGYMSDTLLKLHEANSFGSYLLGRHLGTLEHIERRDPSLLPGGREYLNRFSGIFREGLLEETAARRLALLKEWEAIRTDGSAWEWSRIWPFMRNKHNSNLTTHIGQFNSFEVFTHRSVAEVARSASQQVKLNGRLFNRAFFRLLKPFMKVPLAVTMMPLYGNYRVNEFMIGLKHMLPRRLIHAGSRKPANPLATQRSNQDFIKLWEASEGMRALRREYLPETLERALCGPGAKPLLELLDPAIGKVDCLHIRYTMLYLDRWRRKHG